MVPNHDRKTTDSPKMLARSDTPARALSLDRDHLRRVAFCRGASATIVVALQLADFAGAAEIPTCLTDCRTLVLRADTITFRPDEDTSRALEVLTRDGSPVSAVVRAALIDAARRKAAAAIRAEAEIFGLKWTWRARVRGYLLSRRQRSTLAGWEKALAS